MQVTVPCLAKLNLDLRVLHKRPDGYHELRTIFQTISLRDQLRIEFDFAKRTQIDLISSIDIADNLVVRSAKRVLDHLKIKAWVRFALDKQIPMGAGLGGGSSDAASVLIALPALAGKMIRQPDLVRLAESLGSDVPFFLYGGTAVGLGRGSELYPLPDQPAYHVLVIATGIHVSTADAYRALDEAALYQQAEDSKMRAEDSPLARGVTNPLTSESESPILREFQTIAWSLNGSNLDRFPLKNDFEQAVFSIHGELATVVKRLRRQGARPALMTGSGSAVFGVFPGAQELRVAASKWPPGTAYPVRFVSRRQYRSFWRRALGAGAAFSCLS